MSQTPKEQSVSRRWKSSVVGDGVMLSGHVTPGQVIYFLGAIGNNIFLRIK